MREIACLVISLIYALFALSTTLLFYYYRDDTGIRHRSVRLTVFSGIINIPLTIILLSWTPMNSNMPGWVIIWVLSLLVPLWVLLLFSRFIRLVFLYRISEAKLLASEQDQSAKGLAFGYSSNGRCAVPSIQSVASLISKEMHETHTIHTKAPSVALDIEQELTPEQLLQRNWFHRNRRRITSKFYIRAIGICMLLHIAATTIVCVIYEYIDPIELNGPIRENHFSLLPLEILCLVWYGILLFFLREQTKVRDSHGIHLECKIWMPISALLYTAFLVSSWAFPDTTSKVHPPSPFPPAAYAAIHFVCGHCIFVVWPAFCVFFARRGRRASADSQTIKQEQDHRAFEQMLSDSSRFKKFKAFCVTDFSVENALFLERYRRFKHLAEMGNQTGSASNSANSASKIIEKGMAFFTGGTTSRPQSRAAEYSDSATDLSTYAEQPLSNEATKEFKIIYATFIAPESEFEINLTSSCRQNIITNIHNGNINTGILDEAEREIYQLVYHSTYPRYIAYKKRRISVASNVGVGTRINQHIGL